MFKTKGSVCFYGSRLRQYLEKPLDFYTTIFKFFPTPSFFSRAGRASRAKRLKPFSVLTFHSPFFFRLVGKQSGIARLIGR